MNEMSDQLDCNALSNGTETPTEGGKIVFTLLYCVIITLGLLFNAVALWIFQHHIHQRSGTTVYMRNLAIADLLLVCFLPFRITDYYYINNNHSRLLCEISVIIFLVNMYASIFFLTCISLDRCVATVLPLKVRIWHLHKAAPWVSGVVWLLTVGSSFPPYLKWKVKCPNSNSSNCLQPIVLTEKLPLVFTLTIGFGLPFCLVLTCSVLALVKVRKACSSQAQNARKTQKMILSNLLVFTFCFLPYHLLLSLYKALNLHSHPSGLKLFQAMQLLASTNAVLDPMVYYFVTEDFQKTQVMRTVYNMVRCKCNSEEEVPRESCEEHKGTYKKTSQSGLFK
ncbi:lysophosphatidic acid receptor 6-like isoform X1 [Carcharodon carcharias]|uniref:lysophosphatidic acid receptor 6-like isoform X1 n=2 Tax=Carcharodon carcharias TaxID=13397 RepID=UPI001B7F3CA8|nr:lysophosphatidic acid receptor 6-like isoform X1 [Carcharodon carcharias]